MKKLFTTFMIVALAGVASSSNAQSCCKKPSGNDMQALALNREFKAAHEAPLPLSYTAEKGSMIKVPTDGADANVFFIPADESTDKILIVVHEWWGLNDYIKREAENWQKLLGGHVAVYAVDLYDGKVAATPDEAGKLMNTLDPKRAQAILNGVIQKVGTGKKIATIGWCMGGSWSFAATVLAGNEAAGCVMYYGFPDKDMSHIKPLKADVVYIRGSQDNFIKEPDVKQFEKDVNSTGHKFSLYTFDAPHAFANPSNPKYNAKDAGEAQAISLKFLKEKLAIE
jgi:carboxymethylenebutenolidase